MIITSRSVTCVVMNGRLLFVAGGLVLVWTLSVLALGVATIAGGVGLQAGAVVPIVAATVVASVLLVAYYAVVRFRGDPRRRPVR